MNATIQTVAADRFFDSFGQSPVANILKEVAQRAAAIAIANVEYRQHEAGYQDRSNGLPLPSDASPAYVRGYVERRLDEIVSLSRQL